MDHFRVELDSPNGVFFPGQLVIGKVVLQIREQIKARALQVNIQGRAKTSWTVWERRHRHSSNSTTVRTRSESVPYSAEIVYIDILVNVWQPVSSSAEHQMLQPGLHNFPFTFTVPVHCPPSFEGTIGFIRYSCRAKIDRPWKFDDITKTIFTVMPNFDLNTINYSANSISKEFSKDIGILCFKHGRLGAKIKVAKSGFVPGEDIQIFMEVANSTSKNLTRIECQLIEGVIYTARRHQRIGTLINSQPIDRNCDVEKRLESRIVAQTTKDFELLAHSNGIFQQEFSIPPIVPSFNICPIIQVDYKLKVKIITKGKLRNTLTGEIPIIIGTIPVCEQPPTHGANQMSVQDHTIQYPPTTLENQNGPPPYNSAVSYADSVFGHSSVIDDDGDKTTNFIPKYVFYKNI